jgi:hypothetical protein
VAVGAGPTGRPTENGEVLWVDETKENGMLRQDGIAIIPTKSQKLLR